MTAWRIIDRPFEGTDPRSSGVDPIAWTWEIERGGQSRKVTIVMSGALLAATAHPSDDAAADRETKGRNLLRGGPRWGRPPRYRESNTARTLADNLIEHTE